MTNTGSNLRKMFDFHTAVVLVVTVASLLPCTTLGTLEDANKQQHINHHNHHQLVDKQQQQHHHHHHHHHHDHQQHRNQHKHTTPSMELTTNVPDDGDNDSTYKTDDEMYKTITMNSLTSPTSTPSHFREDYRAHQLEKPLSNQRTGQHLILNSLHSSHSAVSSHNRVEHRTHPRQQQQENESRHRYVPTPLPPMHPYLLSATTQEYNRDGGGYQKRSSSTSINPLERSKYSSHSDAMERDNNLFNRPPSHPQHRHHLERPQEHRFEMRQHPRQLHKPEEDYYDEYNDDDDGDEDEDDIDGFIDDIDNSLSDRSYARITRSKLDYDYADDEPYQNDVNDERQRDAPPGALTEQKYLDVGNERAVQQARERYIQEQKRPKTPHELATEHWQRMIHATKCRKPLPRVIPVSNNTSKRYEPYATILHRCGEDTGCCGSTASVCTVKRYEVVMVYVFSYDFNYRKEIEALPMHNHTECHCVNRASLQYEAAPRGKRSGESLRDLRLHALPTSHHVHQPKKIGENMLNCQCPRHFSVSEDDVEWYAHLPRPHTVSRRKCRCDCQLDNQTCLRFKQGEEGFSLEDRRCILEHNCMPPSCSFGDFHLLSGRCPSYKGRSKHKL